MPCTRTAILLAIGDEILTGKVRDTNTPFAIEELYRLGVELRCVHVLPDDAGVIARYVAEASAAADVVLTSGGVGPTHDDVTLEAVALAFGVERRMHPRMVDLIRAWYGARATDAHFQMALLPEIAEVVEEPSNPVPILRVRNVYILPGEPTFFRRKVEALRDSLRSDPYLVERIYLDLDEAEIADLLRSTQAAIPGVKIGSYPRYAEGEIRLLIVVESKVEEALRLAADRLHAGIPAGRIVEAP